MASTERQWLAIEARLFTEDGSSTGVITIPTTCDYHVKQQVIIRASGLPTLGLDKSNPIEVKRVINSTQMIVGPRRDSEGKGGMHLTVDLSDYKEFLNPTVQAPEQQRPSLDQKTHDRATYEEEPIMAKRVIPVDKRGQVIGDNNGLPVERIDYATVFPLIEASGLLNGCVFSSIRAFPISDTVTVLQYANDEGKTVCRVPIEYINNREWSILGQTQIDFLLQENGDFILQEDGSCIIL